MPSRSVYQLRTAEEWIGRLRHTVLAPETIHLGPLQKGHVPQDGQAGVVELEAVLGRVDVVAVLVGPALEKLARSLVAEAVVVGHETEEGEGFGKAGGAESGVMADVGDAGVSCVVCASAVTGVEWVQVRWLGRCELVLENTDKRVVVTTVPLV